MEENIAEYYRKNEEEKRNKTHRMAICYDFDKTLSPDDMQSFTIIPSFGIDKNTFWNKSNQLARDNFMDNNLSWMYMLLDYSKHNRKSLKKDYFQEVGSKIPLYAGVETWFNTTTKYAKTRGIELEHYIISSGLKEIIEGSKISHFCKRIYGSSYLYSTDGVAEWPAQAVNYTNKTQFIFRIAKGCLEEFDDSVNNSVPDRLLRIPYENIVYIGDSATDIPCMRLVKSKGGYSIGVYDPITQNKEKVYQLYQDGRLSFYAEANYSARSNLMKYIKLIINEIANKECIKTEQNVLKTPVDLFTLRNSLLQTDVILNENAEPLKPHEKKLLKEMKKETDKLSEYIK